MSRLTAKMILYNDVNYSYSYSSKRKKKSTFSDSNWVLEISLFSNTFVPHACLENYATLQISKCQCSYEKNE